MLDMLKTTDVMHALIALTLSTVSLYQLYILKALLLLMDPAELGSCDNRGDPVRKRLFKSVNQLLCLFTRNHVVIGDSRITLMSSVGETFARAN